MCYKCKSHKMQNNYLLHSTQLTSCWSFYRPSKVGPREGKGGKSLCFSFIYLVPFTCFDRFLVNFVKLLVEMWSSWLESFVLTFLPKTNHVFAFLCASRSIVGLHNVAIVESWKYFGRTISLSNLLFKRGLLWGRKAFSVNFKGGLVWKFLCV